MISPTLLLGSNRFSTALQQNRAQSTLHSLLISITIMSMIILKSYRKMTNKQGARCNLRAKLPEVNTVRVFFLFFCFCLVDWSSCDRQCGWIKFDGLCYFFLGMLINSTILVGNTNFLGNLSHFLSPAVGNSSQWLLCHRASTHGWAVSTFHTSCDHKPNTVTIIKKGQYVFGGYTDITWGKNFNLTSNSLCLERPN